VNSETKAKPRSFDSATCAGLLDHELTRAIDRLRAAVRDLNHEISALEAEQARRAKRRRREERR
jgi:hypothetical protein